MSECDPIADWPVRSDRGGARSPRRAGLPARPARRPAAVICCQDGAGGASSLLLPFVPSGSRAHRTALDWDQVHESASASQCASLTGGMCRLGAGSLHGRQVQPLQRAPLASAEAHPPRARSDDRAGHRPPRAAVTHPSLHAPLTCEMTGYLTRVRCFGAATPARAATRSYS